MDYANVQTRWDQNYMFVLKKSLWNIFYSLLNAMLVENFKGKTYSIAIQY